MHRYEVFMKYAVCCQSISFTVTASTHWLSTALFYAVTSRRHSSIHPATIAGKNWEWCAPSLFAVAVPAVKRCAQVQATTTIQLQYKNLYCSCIALARTAEVDWTERSTTAVESVLINRRSGKNYWIVLQPLRMSRRGRSRRGKTVAPRRLRTRTLVFDNNACLTDDLN